MSNEKIQAGLDKYNASVEKATAKFPERPNLRRPFPALSRSTPPPGRALRTPHQSFKGRLSHENRF